MQNINYKPYLKKYAKENRHNLTRGEVILWSRIKGKKIKGYQFYRQKPLLNYIVDFYCPAVKLVIEIDGAYHLADEQIVKDKERDKMLSQMDFNILRFSERQLREDADKVISAIYDYIDDYESQHV